MSVLSIIIYFRLTKLFLVDIEVNASNIQQIQQFEGSTEGTTIQNLEPGTYTVNEIKHNDGNDQLVNFQFAEDECKGAGFTDGGRLFNLSVDYRAICFEYEDEQGNDCSTITLAAGKERTCTVKNYIRYAELIP